MLDGLIVYDIQDEQGRIDKPRTFPFMETHDQERGQNGLHNNQVNLLSLIKSVFIAQSEHFRLVNRRGEDTVFRDLVLVGSPSSSGDIN